MLARLLVYEVNSARRHLSAVFHTRHWVVSAAATDSDARQQHGHVGCGAGPSGGGAAQMLSSNGMNSVVDGTKDVHDDDVAFIASGGCWGGFLNCTSDQYISSLA